MISRYISSWFEMLHVGISAVCFLSILFLFCFFPFWVCFQCLKPMISWKYLILSQTLKANHQQTCQVCCKSINSAIACTTPKAVLISPLPSSTRMPASKVIGSCKLPTHTTLPNQPIMYFRGFPIRKQGRKLLNEIVYCWREVYGTEDKILLYGS